MANTNNQNIKTIFQTMDYGKIVEDVQIVKEWLEGRNKINTSSGLKKIVNNRISGEELVTVYLTDDDEKQKFEKSLETSTSWTETSNWERTKLMKKFAKEIEQNTDLICKIESCTRGLLTKDTKKYGVSLLIEYLQYFANWSFSSAEFIYGPSFVFPPKDVHVKVSRPGRTSIVYASDNTCLGALGFALGPSLAHACNVIFHVEPALSVCVALLIELSIKAGIPKGVLKLVVSEDSLWTPMETAMLYLFGDLKSKKFDNTDLYFRKRIVAVSNNKIPFIIFNGSDLDSACECAVSAIWEYGGMLPWAVGTILVQEDIYEEFISKIKRRLKTIRIGNGNDKLADISYPMPNEIKKFKDIIKDAREQGIDVYQSNLENADFQPTLFIGTKVYTNNVIGEDKNISPAASILPFRTPKEAVTLANNNRQGFAASVWCENSSLLNEVTKQLNVGTVWVNSHGIIKASVPFTTYKLDGAGYIGGPQGFYEQEDQCTQGVSTKLMKSPPKSIADVITSAWKAQAAWSRLSFNERANKLSKWALDLKEHESEVIGINDLDEFISTIYECITKLSSINNSTTIDDLDLNIKRESVGVIVSSRQETFNIPLTLGALLLGNAVIIISARFPEQYASIAKFLPTGLLAPVNFCYGGYFTCTQADPKVAVEGTNSYSERFQKCYNKLEDWESILRRCTISKNIWITSGNSVL